jgi:hypothetical protein
MLIYNKETPILLLVFNRPLLTKRVFEAIKMVEPKKLYVVADGARNIEEQKNVMMLEIS